MTQHIEDKVGTELDDAAAEKSKVSKAEKLEAKAARLRDAEKAKQEKRTSAPPPRRRGLYGWPLVAAGVAAVLLVAAVVFLTVRVGQESKQADDANKKAAGLTQNAVDRAGALAAAQKYAIDFGSYDYAKLDQDFQLVSSHLTPAFASKYKQISDQLRTVIVQYKGKSTATVEGAGVQSLTGSSAIVLMFLDQTVTTTQSTTPRIDRNRLKITLQHQANGNWLISDLALV